MGGSRVAGAPRLDSERTQATLNLHAPVRDAQPTREGLRAGSRGDLHVVLPCLPRPALPSLDPSFPSFARFYARFLSCPSLLFGPSLFGTASAGVATRVMPATFARGYWQADLGMCLDLGMHLDLGIALDLGMWLDWECGWIGR